MCTHVAAVDVQLPMRRSTLAQPFAGIDRQLLQHPTNAVACLLVAQPLVTKQRALTAALNDAYAAEAAALNDPAEQAALSQAQHEATENAALSQAQREATENAALSQAQREATELRKRH